MKGWLLLPFIVFALSARIDESLLREISQKHFMLLQQPENLNRTLFLKFNTVLGCDIGKFGLILPDLAHVLFSRELNFVVCSYP
jgi:hypothetical protein